MSLAGAATRYPNLLRKALSFGHQLPKYVRGSFTYNQYDSSLYWRGRAAGVGQSRVLWQNEKYNELVRQVEEEILRKFIVPLPTNATILEIGCGIGVIATMLTKIHATATVHAVDFPEMIDVARADNPSPRIEYI